MAAVPDHAASSELFEEILLCARYGEVDDLREYFAKLPANTTQEIIRQQDARGNTALHFCCANGHDEVLKLLLRHEQSGIDLQNEGGNTALHWACLNGHLDTVKLLIDFGADVKLKNNGARMPIDEAESQNKESVVLWLLALDMKREKEAGENGAGGEDDEGDVNVNLAAGDTTALHGESNAVVDSETADALPAGRKGIDDVDMLD